MPSLNLSTITQAASVVPFSPSDCNDIHDCRKLRDIIWSCLVTIFACIWVSVHPNCPSTDHTDWQAKMRRVKLSLIALIAPEVIAAWALQQFRHARRLKKRANKDFDYKDRPKLTMSHAFLVIMGGCVSSRDSRRPVNASELWNAEGESDKLIALRNIRECDITDKSKSDALARTLTFLQTIWFIIQCIARAMQRLPLTKLEIVTLAYAALSGFSYAMWWYKPMDLRVPIPLDPASNKTSPTESGPKKLSWHQRFSIYRIDRILTLDHEEDHSTRLFWTSKMPGSESEGWYFYVTLVLGVLFGGIHIIPWNFSFPTHLEHLLWRICTAIICAAPVAIFLAGFTIERLDISTGVQHFIYGLPIITYFPARIVLLVLSFLTLRALEQAIYRSIAWVNLLPHIG